MRVEISTFNSRSNKNIRKNNQIQNKLSMKKTTMAAMEYEKPQVTTILLQVEQGFSVSEPSNNSSMLDDMKETNGEWAY